jgi:membrane-anchored protein YejM (alkaline phosphatase superfamily)
MNRRKFALSWGRKIFFGISWPLSSILALVYLRSFILPETGVDWIYFASTFVGHLGFLNALLYFILFCPVALMFPGYYISRIWSVILLASFNIFILVDALSFSNYHLHVYSYILKLVTEEGPHHLLGSAVGLMLLVAGSLVLLVLVWIRGEITWRHMQGRFTNPVSNWYLGLIFVCLILSKVLYHFSGIHPKLADMFAFNYNFKRAEKNFHDNRRFYYSDIDLQCQAKQNPNFAMIILPEWNSDEFNQTIMPKTFHMRRHGVSYYNHHRVAVDVEAGLFSLLYGIPSSYKSSVDKGPIFRKELERRNYEVVELAGKDSANADLSTMSLFRQWLMNRSGAKKNSFFLLMNMQEKGRTVDEYIQEVVLKLQNENLLKNTYLIITGATATNSEGIIPLLWISPDRKAGEIRHVTTTYDVLPTLLSKAFNCKKAFKASVAGTSLDQEERDWYLVALKDGFQIIDLKKKSFITVKDGIIENAGGARRELIFPALRLMTRFNRPH